MPSIADQEQQIRRRSSDSLHGLRIVRMKSILRVSTAKESLQSVDIRRDRLEFSSRDDSSSIFKRITFKDVTIREYGLTVGDNPSCSSGAPLSLDWKHTESHSTPLEVYERIRAPRRRFRDLILNRDDRLERLTEDWQVSRIAIAQAVNETFKTKNQRRRSVHKISKKVQKMDMFIESARRKLKRTLFFQKRTSVRVDDMMEQASMAAAHMAAIADANEIYDDLENSLDESDQSKYSQMETNSDDSDTSEDGVHRMEEPVYEYDSRHQYTILASAA